MSEISNTLWLEHAYESCMEAIEMKDWTLAKAIAQDTADYQFDSAAKVLFWEINKAQKGLEKAVSIL